MNFFDRSGFGQDAEYTELLIPGIRNSAEKFSVIAGFFGVVNESPPAFCRKIPHAPGQQSGFRHPCYSGTATHTDDRLQSQTGNIPGKESHIAAGTVFVPLDMQHIVSGQEAVGIGMHDPVMQTAAVIGNGPAVMDFCTGHGFRKQ